MTWDTLPWSTSAPDATGWWALEYNDGRREIVLVYDEGELCVMFVGMEDAATMNNMRDVKSWAGPLLEYEISE